MSSYRTNRFLPIVIISILIVVVALIAAASSGFFSSFEPSTDSSREALRSTTADRAVRLTYRGPIKADENHYSYIIEVSPSARILTVYKGYERINIGGLSLENNVSSYEQFVYALDRANMMNGAEAKGDSNDTRGICAEGYLYKFETLKDSKPSKTLWTTSCGDGSLRAGRTYLRSLFIDQIPNAQTKIDELWS